MTQSCRVQHCICAAAAAALPKLCVGLFDGQQVFNTDAKAAIFIVAWLIADNHANLHEH